MIVLPLVRSALLASDGDLSLQASVHAERLRVVLSYAVSSGERERRLGAEVSTLRDQLQRVYGERGTLTTGRGSHAAATNRVILEVPYEHDDRTDS